MLSMIGALMLAAIAPTAVSAQPTAKCTPNGTTKTLSMLCVQNSAGELLVLGLPALETIEVLGKDKPGTDWSLTVMEGIKFKVFCTGVPMTALADGSPTASAQFIEMTIAFETCEETEPPECTLAGTKVQSELLLGTIGNEDGDITFTPAEGKTWFSFEIVSVAGHTCADAGKYTIQGEVLGTLLTPEEDGTTHLLDFEEALGLSLHFGAESEPAQLTLTEELQLDKPTAWTGFPEHPAWGLFLTETIS
jgi:hypothetical protein